MQDKSLHFYLELELPHEYMGRENSGATTKASLIKKPKREHHPYQYFHEEPPKAVQKYTMACPNPTID